MDAEKVMKLFDWLWFEGDVFKKEPKFSFSSSSEANPDRENENLGFESISRSDSLSPRSVLSTSKLQSIFSEIWKKTRRRGMREEGEKKSLSQLEYEEVKGFMDLGFVFEEEDRNSSLVSIIPGLHRLGKNENEESVDGSKISRPYLSETWQVLDIRSKNSPLLMNWRLPCLSNEVEMKESLKCWAHAVASTVR